MTTFRFGDVILIEFPHTDLRGKSKRPALVLYDANDQDVLVARITTQEYTTESDYRIVEWKKKRPPVRMLCQAGQTGHPREEVCGRNARFSGCV